MHTSTRETRSAPGSDLYFGPSLTPGQEYAIQAVASPSGREAHLANLEVRTLLELAAGTPGPWLGGTTPAAPGFGRRRWLRELFGNAPADSAGSVAYVQEINTSATDGAASATAEAAAAPEVEIQFAGDRERIGRITAWIPATEEIFDDAAGLSAYVDGRLTEQLFIAETWNLLRGNGTYPQLRGLLTGWSGVLTQTSVNGDPFGSIALACGKVENQRTTVDGIVMNTTDYWTGVGLRHSGMLDAAAIDANGNVYGRPTVVTPDMPAGKAVVGSFRVGGTIREKTGVTIRASDSHSDFFVKGKRAIIAELDEALVVHRPDYFCVADVDVTP